CDNQGKRQAEPQEAIVEKYPHSLALETAPDEQTRKEEKKRHQKDVLPCTEQVEAKPPLDIDDRERAPKIRGMVEPIGCGRQKIEIGQDRVKREHEEDDKTPQIVECQAHCRRWPATWKPVAHRSIISSTVSG